MSKRPKNRKPQTKMINCFNCANCLYVGEGGYICSMTNEFIIDDFVMPTEEFYSCAGKDFEII